MNKKLVCVVTKNDGKILGVIDADNLGLNNPNLIAVSKPTQIPVSSDPWETRYFEGDLKPLDCDEVWFPVGEIVSVVLLRQLPGLFAKMWGLTEVTPAPENAVTEDSDDEPIADSDIPANYDRNSTYCPRCNAVVKLEYYSKQAQIYMFGCSNKGNCAWHRGIAKFYRDKTPVPVMEELWRSIALDALDKVGK